MSAEMSLGERASESHLSGTSLSSLVGNPEVFIRDHWNKKPFLNQSKLEHRFSDLFSLSHLDSILAMQGVRAPHVRLTRDRLPLHEDVFLRSLNVQKVRMQGIADTKKIADELRSGAMLELKAINYFHPPLQDLCRRLGSELQTPAEGTACVITRNTQPPAVHHADAEMFILQVHGTRRWEVHDQVVASASTVAPAQETTDTLRLAADLSPGDCLYIPRNSSAQAITSASLSCHVSIVLKPLVWKDVIAALVTRSLRQDFGGTAPFLSVEILEGLVEEAGRHLHEVLSELRATEVHTMLRSHIQEHIPSAPARAGFLEQEAKRHKLDLASRVSRNTAVRYFFNVEADGRVRLIVGPRTFRYPKAAQRTLSLLDSADNTPISDLPTNLNHDDTLKLVGHLVQNGILWIT